MNDQSNLPVTTDELRRLEEAATRDAGLQRMLKFRKGRYYIGDDEVEIGTEFIAHCIGFTKCWVKFVDKQFIERKMYRVASTAHIPERDELGDMDSSQWGPGMKGPHTDPWSMQYLLPLEDPETGEIVVFVTPSVGGQRAVSGLCGTYVRRRKRDPKIGNPVIALEAGEMKTSQWGDVDCPILRLTNWTNSEGDPVREVTAPAQPSDDMNDEIPF